MFRQSERFCALGIGDCGSTQSVSVLNQDISNASMSVMTDVSSSASANVSNVMTLDFSGGTFKDNTVSQTSKIDITSVVNASVDGSLQDKITAKVQDAINQHTSDFPQLTATKSATDIKNIVQQNVNTTFSTSSLNSVMANIHQNMAITVSGDADVEGNTIDQSTQAALKLSNTLASNISTDLGISSDNSTTVKQDNTFWGSDLINSIGNLFGDLLSGPIIVIILIVLILVGGIWFIKMLMSNDTVAGPTVIHVPSLPPAPVAHVTTAIPAGYKLVPAVPIAPVASIPAGYKLVPA